MEGRGETCRYWRAGWCPCPCAGPGPRMAKEGGGGEGV